MQIGEGISFNIIDFIISLFSSKSHFTQEKSNSCVIASTRNIIKRETGKNVSESQLRDEMRDIMGKPNHDFERKGINPKYAAKLLEKYGVKSTTRKNVSTDDLAKLTKGKNQVMIGFKNPGHRVVLDSVSVDKDGNKTYRVLDPGKSKPRNMTSDQFNKKYNSGAIVIIPE